MQGDTLISPSVERSKRRRKSTSHYTTKKALARSREQRFRQVISLSVIPSFTKNLFDTSIEIIGVVNPPTRLCSQMKLILELVIEIQDRDGFINDYIESFEVCIQSQSFSFLCILLTIVEIL